MRSATTLLVLGGALIVAAIVLVFLGVGNLRNPMLFPGVRLHSPNGKYVGEFYGLGGGGAAGWTFSYLQIVKSGSKFVPRSNVVFVMAKGYEMCLRWLNDRKMLVQYPEGAIIEKKREQVEVGASGDSVQIHYTPRRSNHGKFVDTACSGTLSSLGGTDASWVVQ